VKGQGERVERCRPARCKFEKILAGRLAFDKWKSLEEIDGKNDAKERNSGAEGKVSTAKTTSPRRIAGAAGKTMELLKGSKS